MNHEFRVAISLASRILGRRDGAVVRGLTSQHCLPCVKLRVGVEALGEGGGGGRGVKVCCKGNDVSPDSHT